MTNNVYSVGQVNSYIKNMFSQDFLLRKIQVSGEISNCKYHSSGHIYFTLKDRTGAMAAIMFAGNRRGLTFPMKDGDKVVVTGSIEVYERDGKYQLYARSIQLEGAGNLYLKFEALKKELEEMGMFSSDYKKPIPKYASNIGIVTAPTGAAVRDIIQISKKRNPYVQLILYPALVQGEGAVSSIINGIRALDAMDLDVLIVGRGGGAIEDLWAFNEEAVAREIFQCNTPIISAVGHETDTTIADYVADVRAATPSHGAELAVYEIDEFNKDCNRYRVLLQHNMERQLEQAQMNMQHYYRQLRHLSPQSRLNEKRQYALDLERRLTEHMDKAILVKKHKMSIMAGQLEGMSPAKKLSQGYSYVSDKAHHNISDVQQVEIGDKISIYMNHGQLQAEVTDKLEEDAWKN